MKTTTQQIAMYKWLVTGYGNLSRKTDQQAFAAAMQPRTVTPPDPVEHVQKFLNDGIGRLVHQGLLVPIEPSDQHQHRWRIGIAGKVYAVNRPLPPLGDREANERDAKAYRTVLIKFTLDTLSRLSNPVKDCIRHYQAGQMPDAMWRAVHVGRLHERLTVLSFDPDVVAGRAIKKARQKGSAGAKRKFAKQRSKIAAICQPEIDHRV